MATKKNKWRVFSLDVWGNEEDGYEVNNRFEVGSVSFTEDATDHQICLALKKEGLLRYSKKHLKDVEIDGDDMWLSIDYKGRPELQLERPYSA